MTFAESLTVLQLAIGAGSMLVSALVAYFLLSVRLAVSRLETSIQAGHRKQHEKCASEFVTTREFDRYREAQGEAT